MKELVKQLLPDIPPETNLQLEADTTNTHETVMMLTFWKKLQPDLKNCWKRSIPA